MSDHGEKTCPLCAEEMDLTDQQLKPCKCGYEICVWCWHHIIDLAEKDDTDGRCPACRSPYDKDKIVGMAADRGRLVAGISTERKTKSQKTKIKTYEGRKHLNSVRVIQRNLVYVVGLPINLADEDIFQRKEYFGQYGRVLKVSISRAAAGSLQRFTNSTCNVYITFSKEDEAVRCIQAVNGFVLNGKSLRACFGTTKYCQAWLRFVPCTNPECLYLHEIGPQEDSFTKDEIISAFARSKVQQITGHTNSVQRRSGDFLPPPIDEYRNSSSAATGKPIAKNGSNNHAGFVQGSPPPGSCANSITLPAAASWGTRGSNCHSSALNLACSNRPSMLKPDTLNDRFSSSLAPPVATIDFNLHRDKEKAPSMTDITDSLQIKVKLETDSEKTYPIIGSQTSKNTSDTTMESSACQPASCIIDKSCSLQHETNSCGVSGESYALDHEKAGRAANGKQSREPNSMSDTSIVEFGVSSEKSDLRLNSDFQVVEDAYLGQEDLFSFCNRRFNDSEPSNDAALSKRSGDCSLQSSVANDFCENTVNMKSNDCSSSCTADCIVPDNPAGLMLTAGHSHALSSESKTVQIGKADGENVQNNPAIDIGESSIISDILSLDIDAWDGSLMPPQSLVKFLNESAKQCGSLKTSSSRKGQSSNQSRFSFARQEESKNIPMYNYIEQVPRSLSANPNFGEFADSCYNNGGNVVLRTQAPTPPGFSIPCRSPPPGFSSRERTDQASGTVGGNLLLETSTSLGNPYLVAQSVNMGSDDDIEFMDPAILAVGKERITDGNNNPGTHMSLDIHHPFSGVENETRLQLLLQRYQNQRFCDAQSDLRAAPSGLMEQAQSSRVAPFLQPSRNEWNEIHEMNNVGMGELVRMNKGYQDSVFQVPNSGGLFNRRFGR